MENPLGDIGETLSLARRFLRQKVEAGERTFILGKVIRRSHEDVVGEGALRVLRTSASGCQRCPLSEGRTQVVFGSGNPNADLMFVGEGPGRDEDLSGEPFVGAAGQLLTRIIEAARFRREDVYIANIVKCRPPGNRDPLPEEIEACLPHLRAQIQAIRPRVLCALGKVAAQTLLQSTDPVGKLRGRVHDFEGIKLVATYHPAALLRNSSLKRPTWEDMKLLRKEYDGLEL